MAHERRRRATAVGVAAGEPEERRVGGIQALGGRDSGVTTAATRVRARAAH